MTPTSATPGRFAGRVAVVTGAASGLGRASAERLADDGAHVIAVDVNGDAAEALVDSLPTDSIFVRADVAEEADVDAYISAGMEKFGRVDLHHLNAGIFGSFAELPDLTRSNTMNSLSSGYAASANRSMSGPMSPTEETPPEVGPRPSITGPPRASRIVAPPPAAYISEMPGSVPNGSSGAAEHKGKMLYTFDAGGDGEVSATEGREVVILEPDSMLVICPFM